MTPEPSTRANGRRWATRGFVAACLVAHAALVLDGARRNFAGIDESAHIAAGLSHWRTGSFSLYRVNPPLPDMLAALPVLAARPVTDFSRLTEAVDTRPEWNFGWDFANANRPRFLTLLFLARLPGLLWSLLGAWFVYRWANDLHGAPAGCVGLFAWCFDPTVLAWTQAVTGDLPAAVAGVAATSTFWRYLRAPRWSLATASGALLGVALLTKFTLLVFFAVWPVLALIHRPWRHGSGGTLRRSGRIVAQGALVVALSLAILNLGYGCRGSFRRLKDYAFISQALSGHPRGGNATGALGVVGNRFRGSPLGEWPVPVPADYLSGLDVLRVDFEDQLESYLLGEWRNGGWWYYYLVGLAVKEPLGTLALAAWAVALVLLRRPGQAEPRDDWSWLLPALALLAFVSAQTGTNHHVRYVLPSLPFFAVGLGKLSGGFVWEKRYRGALVVALLAWSAASVVRVHPHAMSYFNEAAGGPEHGGAFLNDSNLDWGQDLLGLKAWLDAHPDARPLGLAYYNYLDPGLVGIAYRLPPPGPPVPRPVDPVVAARFGPRPGTFAVSLNYLLGARFLAPDGQGGVRPITRRNEFTYFNEFTPIASAGHSIRIYRITRAEADAVRDRLGLPPLPAAFGP